MRRLNLTRLALSRGNGTLPGDRCGREGCRGSIHIYCTQHSESATTRWLACNSCNFKPTDTKWVVPRDTTM